MSSVAPSPVSWSDLVTAISVLTALGVAVAGFVAWLWSQLSSVRKELADFQIKVAEKYVTVDTMVRVEERLVGAINGLTDRFERVLMAMGVPMPPRDNRG